MSKKIITQIKNLWHLGRILPPGTGEEQITPEAIVVKKDSRRIIPSLSQLRYSRFFLSSKEKRATKFFSLFALLSLVALGISFWHTSLADVPKQGGAYSEALIGVPQRINPLYSSSSSVDATLTKLTFAGLVKINQNSSFEPELAEDWQLSEDEKTYTFKLKPGVKWPDGEPFTSNDVIFTIQAIKDQAYLSPLRPVWLPVEVAKIDDLTVQFKLSEPFSPFLENATIGILPEHIWRNIPALNAPLAELNLKPVGLGAWRFEELTKNKEGVIKSYTLKPNEAYPNKTPFLEEIVFKFYSSLTEGLNALKSRQVEAMSNLPPQEKQNLSGTPDVTIYSLAMPQYTAVFFNQKNNEILAERSVRTALAWSTNKTKIIQEALKGDGQIIDAPILPSYVGYYPAIRKYPFNPDEAQNILEQNGWQLNPETKVRAKNGTPLQFTLTTVNNPLDIKTAEILRQTWQAMGLKVDLKIVDSNNIQREIIKPREYEALLFGVLVGNDPDPYPFWHSTQTGENGLNLANFTNIDADKVLEEARQTNNQEARSAKYVHFQNILVEEIPAIFLYSPKYNYPLPAKIKGFDLTRITLPADRLTGIENWYIKTKKTWR